MTTVDRFVELEQRLAALEERNTRAEADLLRQKFYLVRRIWKLRDVSSPALDDGKPMTWGEWFKSKYGETVEEFAERAKAENLSAKVLEYELATFGKSALDGSAKAAE